MHIHLVNAAGSMTAPLAVELQNQGHLITGSDQKNIYPPFSTLLKNNHIPLNQTPIDSNIDLAIIGSAYKNIPTTLGEFIRIQKLKIPFISATQYIADNIAKTNSILVAGSFGKTTISSLVAWILIKADFDPSYLVAGQFVNKIPSLKMTSSSWSVIEADESINGLDTQAKFLYYPVKYVILTSADWEHKESYPSITDNLDAFRNLILKIPRDGLLVYNPNSPSLPKIIRSCQAKIIPYDFGVSFSTNLIGHHNHENIVAAHTLSQQLGIPDSITKSAIKSFRGVTRRLQLLADTNNILFIDDFAQSATRVKSALDAVRSAYPNRPISVYFEPHASFLQKRSAVLGFRQAFSSADDVVLGRLKFNPNQTKNNRVIARDYLREIGPKAKYLPLDNNVHHYFVNQLRPHAILIHFSSGGLSGLNNLQQIIYSVKNHV